MTTEKKTISINLPEGMTAEDFQKALASLAKKESKKRVENSSTLFKAMECGPDQEIRISRDFYKGKESLSIRKWYSDNGTGELKPGKGVTFDYENIDDIVEGLFLMKEYLEDHPAGTPAIEQEEEE